MSQEFITAKSKVSSKGWAVIPKEIRDALEIEPGDEVRFILSSEASECPKLEVRKVPADPVAAGFGMLQNNDGRLWTQELVDEHAREVAEDERELRAMKRKRRNTA